MDRFRSLIDRGTKFASPQHDPINPPSPEERDVTELTKILRENESLLPLLSRILDNLASKAEMMERNSLSTHPLMTYYHGQVDAFKSLKVQFTILTDKLTTEPGQGDPRV
jgi:hypothetical protein